MRIVLLALVFLLSGCFTTGRPDSTDQLTKSYTHIKGVLAAPPVLERGNERLILYLLVENKIEEKETIYIAIAENEEKEEILIEVELKLRNTNEAVFLYGEKVTGRWQEFISGVDFDIYAVGYYVPAAKKYQIVITRYGNNLMDTISWGNFLKAAGKAVIKAGSKVVKP